MLPRQLMGCHCRYRSCAEQIAVDCSRVLAARRTRIRSLNIASHVSRMFYHARACSSNCCLNMGQRVRTDLGHFLQAVSLSPHRRIIASSKLTCDLLPAMLHSCHRVATLEGRKCSWSKVVSRCGLNAAHDRRFETSPDEGKAKW